MKQIHFLLVLFVFFISCNGQVKNDNTPTNNDQTKLPKAHTLQAHSQQSKMESAIFGIYCGECGGHCATMIQLQMKDSTVTADSTDSYFKQTIITCTIPIKQKRIIAYAKDIVKHIPASLLTYSQSGATFGCPDCSDGCGIYVELRDSNGKARKFYIDTDTSKMDGDIKSFSIYFRGQWDKISNGN